MSTAFLGCLISHLFFQLTLPALLPLLYSHSEEFQQPRTGANTAKACPSSDTQEQSLGAERRCSKRNQPALEGKAQECVYAPEQQLDSQTEVCAHACAETLSWQPPHRWWAVTKVTRKGESGRANPSVQNSSSVPCLGMQALHYVQLFAIYHLGIWMHHWLTSATSILSSPFATAYLDTFKISCSLNSKCQTQIIFLVLFIFLGSFIFLLQHLICLYDLLTITAAWYYILSVLVLFFLELTHTLSDHYYQKLWRNILVLNDSVCKEELSKQK